MYTKHLKSLWRTTCLSALMASAGIAAADESGTFADMVSGDMSFAVEVSDGFRLKNSDASPLSHPFKGQSPQNAEASA